MRKILVLFLMISYFVFLLRPSASIKKQLDDGDLTISFIYTNKSNAVIIGEDIIISKYNKELDSILKRNQINKIKNVYTTQYKRIEIQGIKSEYNRKFNYFINNKTFCINDYDCNYVYSTKNKIEIEDKTDVIIFNDDFKLNEDISEEIYENWIDTFKIEKNSFVTLIINKDGFIKFVVGKI